MVWVFLKKNEKLHFDEESSAVCALNSQRHPNIDFGACSYILLYFRLFMASRPQLSTWLACICPYTATKTIINIEE